MPFGARVSLSSGVLLLLLAIGNGLSAPSINPSLQRAEVLAAMAAVGLMLVAVLWTRAQPLSPEAVVLGGTQGLRMELGLNDATRTELAWGSHLLLTATSAATILVAWDQRVVLRRGLVPPLPEGDSSTSSPPSETFSPGAICERSRTQGKLVSLVKTALYPGSSEFDPVLPGLPAVMVHPLGERGWVVLGGWSERCFSRSDERWFSGWCERLRMTLETNDVLPVQADAPAPPGC
ncbi:cofactor assembly of complex C subunit B [Synechococcus sp. MIT S9451]|uniref:cofactor assembly of complex C subunit B n=1 Tax=Synechococcus sp. MIT S9451 TaxID=3082543 RepID=UPI0039B4E378